jgi:hypothetical protein
MARKSMKKDAYWHSLAKMCISHGLKPAQVGKVVKEAFPETDINGRHIGAYKRRLVMDEEVEVPVRPTSTLNELIGLAESMVTDEDKFAYTCSIGSTKRSLKCFEYKLTAEAEDDNQMENIDKWVNTLST